MGVGTTAYKIVFLLHILAVVVGFGGPMINGLYAGRARKRQGPAGVAIVEANYAVTKRVP